MADDLLIDRIREAAIPLTDAVIPHDVLRRIIDDADVVLIGEASQGTHEFYSIRSEITRWFTRYSQLHQL